MTLRYTCLVFGTFLLTQCTMIADETKLNDLLPGQVNGWSKSEDNTYDQESLFQYINGGAELYISYGFDRVLSRKYTLDGQPAITVDIFDMRTAANAYGIYTHTRESTDDSYGQGSIVLEGAILFWKDRYFVSVVAEYGTPASEEALRELAQAVSNNIPREGLIPGVVKRLPEENLMKGNLIYFHHHAWLNAYTFIADGNVFNISAETPAVMARYSFDGKSAYVLVAEYPDSEQAASAFASYWQWEEMEAGDNPFFCAENGKWTGGGHEGRILFFVFNAPSFEHATRILEGVAR